MSTGRICRFRQRNQDRRKIFALVTGDGPAVGFGPLALDQIYDTLYTEPHPTPWHPRGDPALAADLAARAADFHDLEVFYHFYGYPAELIEWIESTPAEGRDAGEVAERLGLDREWLYEAAWREGVVPGAFDPAGDPLYHEVFTTNWAVTDASGRASVNPSAYRFKAWLSLEGATTSPGRSAGR